MSGRITNVSGRFFFSSEGGFIFPTAILFHANLLTLSRAHVKRTVVTRFTKVSTSLQPAENYSAGKLIGTASSFSSITFGITVDLMV